MNDSNRQSLPVTSYPSGPPIHSYGSNTTGDHWMTTAPSAGQPLPSYNEIGQGYHTAIGSSVSPGVNGGPNLMHHSYIQQPYLNTKYGSTPDYSHSHFNANFYANNFVHKVDLNSKPINDNSDHQLEGESNTAEGLTARLLDKNSDNGPISSHSPSSQDSGSNSVGYRPWEQPGADGHHLAADQINAQTLPNHPNRPSSAQSDKGQLASHQSQRTTPDTARRTGRSPSAQQFGDNHPIDRLTNTTTQKYQTLTPVPPIPPISAPYSHNNMYGQPPPVLYQNPMGTPYIQSPYPSRYPAPDGKIKMGIAEPDSSTPDVRIATIENSFQVPSISSTTSRPPIGGIPQPSATPPHPQTAQQVVSVPHAPQTVNEHWEAANQVSVPQNMGAQNGGQETEKVTKKKRKRCGECPGCLKKDNCGDCGPCKSVRSHQICKMRKCDQLKTKKEKAAQLAAQQSSGISLNKEMTSLDNPSRNMNGSALATQFTNLGPTDTHNTAVGSAPRAAYGDFASKPMMNNNTYDSNAQPFNNFHMNSQPINGPFNGHGLVSDVNRAHHSPENNGINTDVTHVNRHQMMNNRLKSLIQSRQNQKEINNVQNHNSFGSGSLTVPHPHPHLTHHLQVKHTS
ncbi:uncharacterized protein LOC128965375 isoform X2 [Oppia nitens]|uniref:uncharacterized protein LOC128965375 isoform X2 n=1 Tax=Oppia nitens TaxID=1686743 RepID=UPI0023D996A8|nr:uncharacterized protein LOC128965375 isoform X2 [Oppia nitens]